MTSAAIGFRMHSGWGSLVAVSNDGIPRFVARRHIVVADANIPGSKQPYHHAESLELNEAEEYLARCTIASRQLASAAIREMLSQLDTNEYRVEGAAIVMASERALPSLEKILASHALVHTAEGEFFRRIVREACRDSGLTVTPLRERELEERAKKTFGKKAPEVVQRISSLGRHLGPPCAEMGFEKWVDFFLENYSKPPIRAAKTHNANLRATKHLKAAFQGSKLADLTADGIELYLRKRLRDRKRVRTTAGYIERGELKPATVHQELRVLRRMLNVAVRKKLHPPIPVREWSSRLR